MRGAWVKCWTLALITTFSLSAPASAQEICIDPGDLSILYKPGEPPACEVPAPPNPEVGRLPNVIAFFLAGCAGLMDAMVQQQPEVQPHPSFVQGNSYFEVAISQRERPPLDKLEAYRMESRDYWAGWIGPGSGGGTLTHVRISCGEEYRLASGKP